MTQLLYQSVDDQLGASIISANTFGQGLSDDSNVDSDESTDKYIGFSWGDMFGTWARGADPVNLVKIKFKLRKE